MRALSHDGSWTPADGGIRVMFYDVAVGRMITWCIEDTVSGAAQTAETLRMNGHDASLYRRDYTLLTHHEILAAIAAEQGA